MCKVGSWRPSLLWLAFRRIDFDPHRPRNTEYRGKDIDRDDDYPAACPGIAVNSVPCVKPTDQEHCNTESETPVDGTVSAPPLVGQEEGGDGHAENDDGGDARSEKRSFWGGETGLREKKRCVL